ncbi:hypothetical protein EDD15DRAFT_2309817 [Pisolithus albus]|nr:hypothetical protein EDD15DRAFT_2309817 [Pisolithus albus]
MASQLRRSRCYLHFTLGTLADIIRSLPSFSTHPTINSRSRIKTAQALLSHTVCRARFLLAVGSSIVTDIYLSHFPSESSASHPDEYYILRILQNKQKHARRERKANAVIAAQQLFLQRENNWPSIVPNETITSCLAQYYDGSHSDICRDIQ